MDASSQMYIVAMRLEGDEWRIDNFGSWQNTDLDLPKLAHQPTQVEKNEAAAQETLQTIDLTLHNYAREFPLVGFPSSLRMLAKSGDDEDSPEHAGVLDVSLAGDPAIKDGYEFRYTLTRRGNWQDTGGSARGVDWLHDLDSGGYRLTATPAEFGKTGSKNYLVTEQGTHATTEQRDATDDDPPPDDPD